MVRIIRPGLHHDKKVFEGSILFESAGIHSGLDAAGHIFTYPAVHHATA